MGKLLAFFANNPKGWSVGSKKKITTVDVSLPAADVAAVAKSEKYNKNKKEQEEQPHTKKRRTEYHDAEKISTLEDAVCNILFNCGADFNRHGNLKSTLKYHYVKFKSVAELLDIPFGGVTRDQYYGAISKQSPPLMSMDDFTFLSGGKSVTTTTTLGWAKMIS